MLHASTHVARARSSLIGVRNSLGAPSVFLALVLVALGNLKTPCSAWVFGRLGHHGSHGLHRLFGELIAGLFTPVYVHYGLHMVVAIVAQVKPHLRNRLPFAWASAACHAGQAPPRRQGASVYEAGGDG
jgi:hypothetical protein